MIDKYSDRRATNGGWRANAGRLSKQSREYCQNQLLKKVVVKMFRHGQIRRVKMTCFELALHRLFEKAMKENHIPSARLLLDLAMGKPVGRYRVTKSVPLSERPNPKLVKRLAAITPEILKT